MTEEMTGIVNTEEMPDVITEQTDIEDNAHDTTAEDYAPEQKNNKTHLTSSVPRAARAPLGALTKGEMAEIRSIFGNIDDAEIQRLYKRVTK